MKTCILIISCAVAVLLASTMVSSAQEREPCPPNFIVLEEACVNMGPIEDGGSRLTPNLFQAYCRDMSARGHGRPEIGTGVCPEGEELWVCCGTAEKPTP